MLCCFVFVLLNMAALDYCFSGLEPPDYWEEADSPFLKSVEVGILSCFKYPFLYQISSRKKVVLLPDVASRVACYYEGCNSQLDNVQQ